MMKLHALALALGALTIVPIAAPVFGQTVTAPYKLTVFATAPTGLSAPDSVAVLDDHVFVGYGDGHDPAGLDQLNSQVVEYTMDGSIVHTYTVPGHNDGLKVDPATHLLWAIQNEDANANLVIINPETLDQKKYTFGPTLHGGGYDDVVFRGCKVYISASNPTDNPNDGPAIVSARLVGNMVAVEPVLSGSANATNTLTDATVQLNLQDPDSMTLDPKGDVVLDSQADQELVIVRNIDSSKQRVFLLPLSYQTPGGLMPVETDDTAFVTSSEGFLLLADKSLNKVFILSKTFVPGTAYTAADGGKLVGKLDLTTGVVIPIVTGLGNPGGMMFVDTSESNPDHHGDEGENQCTDRDWNSH